MREYLIFRLYGPLAAWGEISIGEVRLTDRLPTRSALLGLIAGALGIRRSEEEALRAVGSMLRFAVRSDRPGVSARDYHTVQSTTPRRRQTFFTRKDALAATKNHPVVSQRYYREGGAWSVAAWQEDAGAETPWTLQEIAAALRAPRFAPFLGRKSCPLAWPLDPQIHSAGSALEAFGKAACPRWQDHLRKLALEATPPANTLLSWEAGDEVPVGIDPSTTPGAIREDIRRDIPRYGRSREFDERRERSLRIDLPAPEATEEGGL